MTTLSPETAKALEEAAGELLRVVRERAPLRGADPDSVTSSPAEPGRVEELVVRYRLPPVYAEFLRRYASKSFVDGGVTWEGVGCWIVTADGFEALHGSYADQDRWPSAWIVCAGEDEGCYFLDRTTLSDGDCEVFFLPHGSHHDLPRKVAGSFVELLHVVAAETSVAGRGPGQRASGPAPGPAEDIRTFLHFALVALVVLAAILLGGYFLIR